MIFIIEAHLSRDHIEWITHDVNNHDRNTNQLTELLELLHSLVEVTLKHPSGVTYEIEQIKGS